jgi:hypothetical protein
MKDKRRKGKTLFVYAGGNKEKQDKQQEFFILYPIFFRL